MLFSAIIGMLTVIAFYLFYRAEVLKRELKVSKARLNNMHSSTKHQNDILLQLAQNQADLLQAKLNQNKSFVTDDSADTIQLAEAILSQYCNIIADVALKNESVSKSVARYLDRSSDFSAQDLKQVIMKQSDEVKQSWHKNNLNGFIRFCELLIEPPKLA